jgi:hypothetical protein
MIVKAKKDKRVVSEVFRLFYFVGNKQIGGGSWSPVSFHLLKLIVQYKLNR